MTMARKNIIAGMALIVFGIWYAFLINDLPERSIMPNTPGPSFFPIIIVSAILILSAALVFSGLREIQSARGAAGDPTSHRQAAQAIGAFVVFLALLPYAGFIVASCLFFAALMYLYGSRNWIMIIGSSVVIPVALYILFRHGFQIILPRGILAF